MDVTRTCGRRDEDLCTNGRGRYGAGSAVNGNMGRGRAREHQGGGWEASDEHDGGPYLLPSSFLKIGCFNLLLKGDRASKRMTCRSTR